MRSAADDLAGAGGVRLRVSEKQMRALRAVTDDRSEVERLLAAAARGDRTAQEALYRQLVQFVGQVAFAAGARTDIEDIVHDTFLQAFSGLDAVHGPEALRPWIATLTVRQVARRRRYRPWLRLFESVRESDEAEQMIDVATPPDAQLAAKRALRALEQVDDRSRLAWMLRHWHGLSLEQTAESLSVSLATVKRVLRAAELAVAMTEEVAP